jgi:flagellar biosynthesis protein FliR
VNVNAAPELIAGFLLALVRASAFLTLAPPFSTRTIPSKVKVGFAFALALAAAPHLQDQKIPVNDTAAFIGVIALQVFAGVLLGFLAMLVLSSVQAAGSLIDLFGGFTMDSAYDPLSNAQSSVFGRFHQLMATTLLFVIDGHLILVRGFLASFEAVPAEEILWNDLARLVTKDVGVFFLAALEMAGPLIGVMFVSEVALGMLSKAAPQMNVFQLGFPLKIFLTLLLIGGTFTAMPEALGALVDNVLRSWGAAMRMLPGG